MAFENLFIKEMTCVQSAMASSIYGGNIGFKILVSERCYEIYHRYRFDSVKNNLFTNSLL